MEHLLEDLRHTPAPLLRDWIEAHVARVADRVRRAQSAQQGMLRQREEALARQQPSMARQLVQAGLFDRRRLREALRHERARSDLLDEAAIRLSALTRAIEITTKAELAAAIFVRNRARRP
jgi:hypothetical protein